MSQGGDGIHQQQLRDGAVVSPGSRMRGITKATALGKASGAKGCCVSCTTEETELEEHQNKELQKGAVLAQRILLYELSRFRRTEKITH